MNNIQNAEIAKIMESRAILNRHKLRPGYRRLSRIQRGGMTV
jgi:hypothetical protein